MQQKYKLPILGSLLMVCTAIEFSSNVDKPEETRTMTMDKFLSENDISSEDVSFVEEPKVDPETIGTYSMLTKGYEKEETVAPANIVIETEKIADPTQRYRAVDDYYYINKALKAYSKDNPESEVVKDLEYGEYVHVIGKDPYNNDGYSKISIDNKEGFVETPALTKEVLFKERNRTVYALETLSVYQSIDKSTKIDSVRKNKSITMIGDSQDFIKVKVNGKIGFVEKYKISNDMLFDPCNFKVWITSDLNLKKYPSKDSETVKKGYKYDAFTQIGTSEYWSKLKTANGTIVYTETKNLTKKRPISLGEEIARYAQQFVGNRYVYGGTSLTNGTDCSGFTQSVYKHFGYHLNRTASSQRQNGRAVPYSSAKPGDLFFYSGHVAMYIGDGKVVHASNSAPYPRGGIKISPANYRTIQAIRRIVD